MTVANARIAGANSDQARRLNRRQPKQYKLRHWADYIEGRGLPLGGGISLAAARLKKGSLDPNRWGIAL
jgi:hypothetical protein